MAAPLQYLLITVKVVALKKVSLIIRKILRLFVNTLTFNEKNSLLIRDNLTQKIAMQLSKKQKTFFEISFAFLNSLLNFKHLSTKDDPHS